METISLQEIKTYRLHVENHGVEGAIYVYNSLYRKGYNYAGWGKGVATGSALTGQAAIGYMNNSNETNNTIYINRGCPR